MSRTEATPNQCQQCRTWYEGNYIEMVVLTVEGDPKQYGPYCVDCIRKGVTITTDRRSLSGRLYCTPTSVG